MFSPRQFDIFVSIGTLESDLLSQVPHVQPMDNVKFPITGANSPPPISLPASEGWRSD